MVVAGFVAELLGGVGPEVDIGVLGVLDDVGGTGGDELLDEFDDLVHRFDGTDVVARRQHAQGFHVLAEQGGLAHAENDPVLTVALGAFEQRVVDVGDVLHVVDVVAGVAPDAVDQIEGQVGGGVAEVRGVVGGDAAHVHRRGVARGDRTHRSVRGVEQPQRRPLTGDGRDRDVGPRLHDYEPNGVAGVLRAGTRACGRRTAGTSEGGPGNAPVAARMRHHGMFEQAGDPALQGTHLGGGDVLAQLLGEAAVEPA